MIKKTSTSGTAVPSAVSSTTATGYLPQFYSNAAASHSPAVANINDSQMRASPGSKALEVLVTKQRQAEKMVENLPLRGQTSKEAEIIADLHQRMLRDAERRGVIGPGWQ
jgi:hypothetical protein